MKMKLMINNKELFAVLHIKYAQNLAANSSSNMVGYQPKKTLCSPGGMSILNLSTEWLEWMEVETDDHKEMNKMMDMTGAVVDMTGISITEEEHRLDELMTTLAPAMEAVEARNKTSAQKCSDMEEWMEDTYMEGLNFEEWLEEELIEMGAVEMLEPMETTFSEAMTPPPPG